MNIGTAIKTIRLHFDLSQKELSDKSGVSQTSISQIETGNKSPSKNTLRKICKALEVPEAILYIMGLEDSDVPETRKKIFEKLFPDIKDLAIQIIGSRKSKLLS